jgi:hypothetical protein
MPGGVASRMAYRLIGRGKAGSHTRLFKLRGVVMSTPSLLSGREVQSHRFGEAEWQTLVRLLDRDSPDYKT